jgi:hypothetical protein
MSILLNNITGHNFKKKNKKNEEAKIKAKQFLTF